MCDLIIFLSQVELKLVDYADVETVALSSVFALEKRFGEVPTQGLKCHLHGLTPFANSEHTITAEIEYFERRNHFGYHLYKLLFFFQSATQQSICSSCRLSRATLFRYSLRIS